MDDLRPGDLRVPMPQPFVGPHDVAVSPDTRRPSGVGRRFNFDVSEEVLAKIGGRALEAAVVRMGEHVAMFHRQDIERVVHSFILDRAWAEPIIRDAIQETVCAVIVEMFADAPLPPSSDQSGSGEK